MRLRDKILSSTALLVVMMGLITMLGIRYIVLISLQEQLQNKGEMLTRLVAEDIANAFLNEELLAVNKSLKELVNNTDEIIYAYAIDYNRKNLVHTFADGFPVELAKINRLASNELVKTALLDTTNGRIRQIGYQVIPGTGIELHLGFSERNISQAMERVNTILLMVTGFGVAGGVIISLVLSYVITKPLTRFTEQVKQFGKNKIIDQIDVATKDEIGELASSFNEMAVNLKESIAIITQSEESYRKLIEAASDAGEGIAMLKYNGGDELVLWYANEEFQELLNYDEQALFNKSLASIFGQEVIQLVFNLAEGEKTKGSRVEISFVRNDGEQLYLEISASKIIYENSPAYILFCRDIRDRKLIEQEVARTNKDLSALNEIAQAISGQTDLEAVLQKSLIKVLELIGVELG
jgi:PAS domain S-box-containing protein